MKEKKKCLRLPAGIALAMFAMAVLLALVLAAPTATNFGVDDASGASGTYVLVPVNITSAQNGPIAGIGFDILYDNSVITAVGIQAGGLTGDWDWDLSGYANYSGGTAVALVFNGTGTEIINGSTGSVVLLNFSVVGALGTTSPMNLTNIQLSDLDGNVGAAAAKNGTFTVTAKPNCSIDVEKKVWNAATGEWVEEINAIINDTVRFRCVIRNDGSRNLTNITVTDILSDSLEYADNATVDGMPQEPVHTGPGEYKWNFTGPLAPFENITIEFNATAVKSGVDVNWQNATGYCEETGTWVYDNDSAIVSVTEIVQPPTADEFGVDNASGYQNTNVLVPVNITNVQNGPIAGIGFDILYDNSVITAVGIQAGGLTPGWDFSNAYTDYPWGTAVAIVFNGLGTEIGDGSTGSVVLLNFSVVGAPGTTSPMDFTNIQLSDMDGNVGTAAARNGTFTVTPVANITYNLTISSTDGGNVTEPGEGTFTYNASEVVDLKAVADTGYEFVNWSGDVGWIADVNANETTITMNDNYTIMANFEVIVPFEFGVDNASGYQNTNVLVPVNITNVQNGPIAGIGFDILYDNSVITAVGIQAGGLTPGWDFSNAYTDYPWGTAVAIVFNGLGTEIGDGSTGSVVLLNFSVLGAPGTTSPMNFTNIQLSDLDGSVGTAPARNGTFTVTAENCSINVDKKVWNTTTGEWVEEIRANISDTVRFRCVVYNDGGYNLTNITVTDILSDSLEYAAGNATVDGVPQEPVHIGPGEYKWNFTGPLAYCENITIEFDAHAVESGLDVNWQNATGYCEETGTWVSDNDSASVNVTIPPLEFYLSVNDTSGASGTYVLVPVNITNVQNGPIAGIGFDILYNDSVITAVGIQAGDLTTDWDWGLSGYANYPWGTAVALVFNGLGTEIGDGSTGSVVLLNFSVVGAPGTTSRMNLSNIQLSDLNGNVGTAPAKNGTFTVTGAANITGTTGEVNCSIEPNVTVALYNKTTGNKVAETTSDTNGNYTITVPGFGIYWVNASKAGFKNESQEISITEAVSYTLNFRGEHGLTPEEPTMEYALECVNHWLYPELQPEECRLSMTKALEVVNAWLY